MREVLKQLEATPRAVAHLVAECSEERLDSARDGDWSARTILAHLRDDEVMVMRQRAVRILDEDNPVFPDFDETAWAANRSLQRDRREQLLGDFALQRQASLHLLQTILPGQWERPGRHEVSGEYTLESWVRHWLEHDRAHVSQLERALGETLQDVLERRAQMPGNDS